MFKNVLFNSGKGSIVLCLVLSFSFFLCLLSWGCFYGKERTSRTWTMKET